LRGRPVAGGEKHGFVPGYEMQDWQEAGQEISERAVKY